MSDVNKEVQTGIVGARVYLDVMGSDGCIKPFEFHVVPEGQEVIDGAVVQSVGMAWDPTLPIGEREFVRTGTQKLALTVVFKDLKQVREFEEWKKDHPRLQVVTSL